jgi:FKBP-type peptidyl-prolyl cis-trans isomerase
MNPLSAALRSSVPAVRVSFVAFLAHLAVPALLGSSVACNSLTSPPEETASPTTVVTAASAAAPAGQAAAPQPAAAPAAEGPMQQTDLVVGTGAEAKTGSTVSVQYVGTLADGKEFDSSRKRNQPFSFTLGQGQVIRGWDQGVVGMKVGGKRKLVIPPSLAYGARGMPPVIPPNSTLTFEVELVDVKK